ncbi:DUF2732 family protein [Providencia sp.]|uniref:DUF2732 family protein n=1 Tax=Providencia sp. TaxID=589 RepID=UPI00333E7588
MRNIEKKKIMIGIDLADAYTVDQTAIININRSREDERKVLYSRFSDRLATISNKALREKMTADEIIQLLSGESEHFSNLAAELNHV